MLARAISLKRGVYLHTLQMAFGDDCCSNLCLFVLLLLVSRDDMYVYNILGVSNHL